MLLFVCLLETYCSINFFHIFLVFVYLHHTYSCIDFLNTLFLYFFLLQIILCINLVLFSETFFVILILLFRPVFISSFVFFIVPFVSAHGSGVLFSITVITYFSFSPFSHAPKINSIV